MSSSPTIPVALVNAKGDVFHIKRMTVNKLEEYTRQDKEWKNSLRWVTMEQLRVMESERSTRESVLA